MLGAAGAVEAIVCALSVARDAVPPTAGFAEAAEDCPVAVVTEAVTDLSAEGGPVDLAGLRRPQRRSGLLALQRLGSFTLS